MARGKRWLVVGNSPLRRGRVISPAERLSAAAYVAEIYTVEEPVHTHIPPHVDCIIIPASSATHTSPDNSIYCSLLQHPPEMDEAQFKTHTQKELVRTLRRV